jgi:hypothetical protein
MIIELINVIIVIGIIIKIQTSPKTLGVYTAIFSFGGKKKIKIDAKRDE